MLKVYIVLFAATGLFVYLMTLVSEKTVENEYKRKRLICKDGIQYYITEDGKGLIKLFDTYTLLPKECK